MTPQDHDPFNRITDDLLREEIQVLKEEDLRTANLEFLLRQLIEVGIKTFNMERQANRTIIHELRDIRRILNPRLSQIIVTFEGEHMPNPGPLVLTTAGATGQAVVVGFDQFGSPWTGPIPAASFSGDNEASATVGADGLVTAVANGTTNITGSLTTTEGLALTDTEQVIVNIAVEPPVLSSIKVQFQ